MLQIDQPILSNSDLEQLRRSDIDGLKATTLSTVFNTKGGSSAMEARLSTSSPTPKKPSTVATTSSCSPTAGRRRTRPLPALLAVSAINHHLIHVGKRCSARSWLNPANHAKCTTSLLGGFGATAVNPYLAIETQVT